MAMRAALAAHDEVLRGAIEAHGGFAVQAHRRRGVRRVRLAEVGGRCCGGCAAGAGVAGADGVGDRRGRAARTADYFGTVLNRAARVMAAGHGGQVLLDGTTAGLLQRHRPDRSWGRGDYATSPNPVEMFQVLAAGLRSEFPPLQTLDATSGKPAPANDELHRTRQPSWPRCKRR